ncbi:TRAP transporter large permease [Ammoniphilus sp. YIM 78166]|uniref:TRAP transporter large permease n=1 Tax=Ammoniphilus sp. YIM 78166 TaxID=1644106 RepID=UPI00106F633D|nr:TRAP transporter large permease [Ammoniphilus sp. YIM 78166]
MGLFVLALFFLFVGFGVPIGIALVFPSILYIIIQDIPISVVAQRMTYALDSFTLLAVPIFVFVGSLLNTTGITTRIFTFAQTLVGHFTGGLAHVNIFSSLIMSGTSGSALADIGGVGRTLIHAMHKNGYKKEYAAAVTAASATVGPIFPPSIPLIMFGVLSQTSVISLLLGGIVPALLTVVSLMLLTAWIAKKRNFPKSGRSSGKEIGNSFLRALPALLTPVILIAGMLLGYFSPTEAAVVTVVYIMIISLFVYREFSLKEFFRAAIEAVESTAVILFMVASAALFSWVITVEQVPEMIRGFLQLFESNPIILLLIVNLIVLLVGCFLETIASLFLLTPLLVPALVAQGFDPVHVGLIIVFNLMIGLLTPPMGMSLFLSSEIAKTPVEQVLKEVLPYYLPLLLTLMLITFFPSLVLWIPNLVK